MARKYFNTCVAKDLIDTLKIEEMLYQSVTMPQCKKITKRDAVVILETFWDEIDEELVKNAWIDSILKYFLFNQYEAHEKYTLNQKKIQRLIDTDRFINDCQEEEFTENEFDDTNAENDKAQPDANENQQDAEIQQDVENQIIVTEESIENLMKTHYQYL